MMNENYGFDLDTILSNDYLKLTIYNIYYLPSLKIKKTWVCFKIAIVLEKSEHVLVRVIVG